MVAKFKDGLTRSKHVAHEFDVERFHLRKLSVLEYRKEYQIKISNNFVSLDNIMIVRTKIGLGKTLKRISKPQPQKI